MPVITAWIKDRTRPARGSNGPSCFVKGKELGAGRGLDRPPEAAASGQAYLARVVPSPTGASTSPKSCHRFRPRPAGEAGELSGPTQN